MFFRVIPRSAWPHARLRDRFFTTQASFEGSLARARPRDERLGCLGVGAEPLRHVWNPSFTDACRPFRAAASYKFTICLARLADSLPNIEVLTNQSPVSIS